MSINYNIYIKYRIIYLDIVKLLLYMGSDIHVQTIKDGKTAIVFACLESKDDIALLILRKLFNLKKVHIIFIYKLYYFIGL